MKKAGLLVYGLCLAALQAVGQYAPQVGVPGSDGISASSTQFVGWATQCFLQRGFMDIANPSLGYASAGDSSLATGPADRSIVSLGDSGVAVLTFAAPLFDGPGPDFAVFENGFSNPANDSLAFLELGFVEVSSDGVHYFRFPATSLTQTGVQLGNPDYIYANQLNNLAGKYIGMYGTQFDLNALAGIQGLNIDRVTHIRIVDVIGAISGHSSYDNGGRIINDPYPTPYPSCGFDLDAVGVIHQTMSGVEDIREHISLSVYPNPAIDFLTINTDLRDRDSITATVTDMSGKPLVQYQINEEATTIPVSHLAPGMYFIELRDAIGNKWVEKIAKR